MNLTRRRLLSALGAGPVAVAGCCAAPANEVYIRPAEDTQIEAADGEWTIDGSVEATFYLGNEETFQNVYVVVFDEDGDRLREYDLGDIRSEDATDTGERCGGSRLSVDIELTTAAYPYRIELETPTDAACPEDVEFTAAELRAEYDPGKEGTLGEYWRYEQQCGETPTGTERPSSTQ